MIWGLFAWGVQAPQQSRLVALATDIGARRARPQNTGTYLGVTIAGIIGAFGV